MQSDSAKSVLRLRPILRLRPGSDSAQDADFAGQQEQIRDLRGALHWEGDLDTLREQGFTIRKTIDCLIATFCIESGIPLLHADRDFQPFADYLGLKTLR